MARNCELSIVVPLFDEEDSVEPLHAAIVEALEAHGAPFEIILVDDGSGDGTFARLEAIAARDPRVTVLRLARNFGQTAAMTAGIDHARGRVIVTMDGDLQNDPADVPALVAKIEEGYDLAVGWRRNRQDRLLSRKVPSRLANWLIGWVSGLPIRDNGCSLKAYRAAVIKRTPLYSDLHRFIPAMTIPQGARVAQIGVRHNARRFGTSKYGLSRIYKVLLDLIAVKIVLAFARRPLGTFLGLAGSSALVALACIGAGLVQVQAGGVPVVFLTLSVLFGSLALFLACIGIVASAVHAGEARA